MSEVAGRGLDECRPGFHGQPASEPLLVVRQAGAFEDHLHRTAACRRDDTGDVGPDGIAFPVLQPPDIDHHVDLGSAIGDRQGGLVGLGVHVGGAKGEADHCGDPDATPLQHITRLGHPVRVQARGGALVASGDLTRHQDVVLRRRRIEERVVDSGGQLGTGP